MSLHLIIIELGRSNTMEINKNQDSTWSKIWQFISGPFKYSSIRKTTIFLVLNVLISAIFILIFGKEALGTLLSVVLGFFLSKIAITFFDTIRMALEDKKKCNRDNDFLEKIYKENHYLHHLDENSSDKGFLYDECIPYQKNLNILIDDHPKAMMKLDPFIQNYYVDIFGAHKASYVENNITLKLMDYEKNKDGYSIMLSRSTYYNHLVTNRAIDYPIKNGLTLRGVFEFGPKLNELKTSKMSNHLGIIGFVELSDGRVIFPKRQSNSTTSKNLVTASIASRVILDNPNHKITSMNEIETMVKKTIDKRLGISMNDIPNNQYEIHFIGLGRDVYEGGKPHFFYYIKLKQLNSEDFLVAYKKHRKDKLEQGMDMDKMVYLCNMDTIELKKNYSIRMKCSIASKKTIKKIIKVKPEMSFLGALKHYQDYKKMNP